MYTKLLPLKNKITYYFEDRDYIQFTVSDQSRKNIGLTISILFHDKFRTTISTIEIGASIKNLSSDENLFTSDILDELVSAILHNNIYLQKAKKLDMFRSGLGNFIVGVLFLPFVLLGKTNDNLYIVGVNCTQEEIDKMEGLVRMDFNT